MARRGHGARQQLQTVVGYGGAHVVETACLHITLEQKSDTLPITPAEEHQLAAVHAALAATLREDCELRAR
jgi:hypothetical protein